MWLAAELRALPPINAELFFWDGKIKLTSVAQIYRRLLSTAFKEAGVEMTTHHFPALLYQYDASDRGQC